MTTIDREFILPSAVDAEEGVLSCIIAHPDEAAKVQDVLTRDDFCKDEHGHIFDAAMTVLRRGKRCNRLNITFELRKRDQLDMDAVESVLDHLEWCRAQLDDISDFADALKDVSTKRKLAVFGYQLFQRACVENDGSLLEWAQGEMTHISLGARIDSVSTTQEMMLDYIDVLEARREAFVNHLPTGVSTGFTDLDRLTGGLQEPDLVILAARPSVGKTALAVNIALNMVKHSKHALFFSLEMSKAAIAQRLLAMETPIDQAFLRDGDITDEQYASIVDRAGALSELDLKTDDRTRFVSDIRAKARRIHAIKPLDIVVVDYLQLVKLARGRDKGETRAEVVAEISHELKDLAMELNIPVLALAQLNRAIESRQTKKPQMSDLKESGAIEQDADVIIFLSCTEEELKKRAECKPYQVTLDLEKQRNGPVGTIDLMFMPRSTRFANLETYLQPDYVAESD